MKRYIGAFVVGLALAICSTAGWGQTAGCSGRTTIFDIVDVEETDYGYGVLVNLLQCQEDGSWLQVDSAGQIINLVAVEDISSGEFEVLGEEWLLTATYENEVLTVILFRLVDEEYRVFQEVQRVNVETQSTYVLPMLESPGYRIIAMETEEGMQNQLFRFDGWNWTPIGETWTL